MNANTTKNSEKTNWENQPLQKGLLNRSLTEQTKHLPSEVLLWSALGAIGCSLGLQILGKKETSNFVGQWAPTLLILGLYAQFSRRDRGQKPI